MSERELGPFEQFTISVRRCYGVVALTVRGELEMAFADRLLDEVVSLEGEDLTLVVDLSAVSFIDSTGLRTLIEIRHHAQERGHQLELVPPTAAAARIFAVTETRDLFFWRGRSPV